ncbi:MAG TPA: extracellular solute-binding protein [Anaerolineae bacterium]|nr:extracellular solute-binding protein [Anaerolineae bacterium]HOR00605.1 extracellular solute-binding protein [Anaerolineae bacterium]HPL30125.1 extracellular solute-binding protein [Anaerolineae bacterium]
MASRKVTRRTFVKFSLGLLAVPVLQACTPAAPTAAPQPTTKPATQPTAAKLGGSVSVLGTWGGSELESFMAMVKPFEDATGVRVEFEGTRDLNAVLTTRVEGGNPPDVAGLPGPGQMAQFARAGKLVDLAGVLDQAAMREQYAEDWLKLGQVDGKQVGIFIKSALKGLIWYNVKAFKAAGYTVPKTWDELLALCKKIADTGVAPWSIGLESGAASGWPATDWLEDIVLRQAGPDVYDQWYQGKIRWSSPEIKKAWETWGLIVADPRMVFGGKDAMLATNFGDAANPLFTTPPTAYLHHQASFITDFIVQANPALKPVEDFDFFPFPDIDPKYAGAVEGGGDLFGMFKDTPQARALMAYLTTPEAQAIWVKRGGALSPNRKMGADVYPDTLTKGMGDALTGAKIVRFDASDLMPEAMNNAFWKATLDYVGNPASLDSILADLDKVQADAYK